MLSFGEVNTTENLEDDFLIINISDYAVMVGFLLLRLNGCVGPTPPYDAIIIDVVLPAVQLTIRERVALLLAIIINI